MGMGRVGTSSRAGHVDENLVDNRRRIQYLFQTNIASKIK